MRGIATTMSLIALGFGGCSAEVSAPDEFAALEAQQAALGLGPGALASARRQTLVEGITGAENLLFTRDGRLLVSADAGIFELVREASGAYAARPLLSAAPCSGAGLAEVRGVVYANCYDFTDSQLYAAELTATPTFRPIHAMPGIALANGLAADGVGNLYVAATLQGQILRLHVDEDDPFAIAAQEVWLASPGLFVNGLKLRDGTLYWTDFGTIKTAALRPDGRAGRVRTLVSDSAFYDDLFVDDMTIVVASVLDGGLRAFDLRGRPTGNTQLGVLDGPSALVPAKGRLGLPRKALVVTERNANRVSLFGP